MGLNRQGKGVTRVQGAPLKMRQSKLCTYHTVVVGLSNCDMRGVNSVEIAGQNNCDEIVMLNNCDEREGLNGDMKWGFCCERIL